MSNRAPIVAVCLALGLAHWVFGQGPKTTDAQTAPRQFRRIIAPADRIDDWGLGTDRYIPLKAEAFERLLETMQAGAGLPPGSTVKITRAAYEAVWADDGVLLGRATFEIAHDSTKPSLLPLEPFNVAISSAMWLSGKTGKAVLGQGPDNRLGVLVERSGRLQLEWSMSGARSGTGASQFSFALPRSPMSHLIVDLPERWIALADAGLMSRDRTSAVPGRWKIELGGASRLNLRVLSEHAARERRQFTLLRQAMTYEFLPRGVDVSAQLRLDIHSEPLQTLVVELDQPLKLVSARYGEIDVPWSVEEKSGKTRVTLLFQEPLSGIGRMIRLSAIAPLELDKSWTLPGIRPQRVLWQEGSATLLVPGPLMLEQIQTRACRQSRTSALPAPLAGDSFEVQYYSPQAAVDVVVARPRDPFKVSTQTLVELGTAEARAELRADFSLGRGERFVVSADVHPKWAIKNVQADNVDLISSWETTAEKGARRLVVRLARAVSPSRQVTLRIVGRRPAAAGEKLTAHDLAMLSLEDAKYTRETIAVGAVEGYELTSLGDDDLRLIDLAELDQRPPSLLASLKPSLAFLVDQGASALEVAVDRVEPRYTADVQIDVAAQGKTLNESYVLRCTPGAQRIDRLLLRFSSGRSEPLEWSLAGKAAARVTARKLESPPSKGGASGEQWEIALRNPRSEPFEIRGVRSVPFSPRYRVALLSLPEASRQTGTLAIRALGETELAIEKSQLNATSPELLGADRQQSVRSVFRFDPARDFAAEVVLSPSTKRQYVTGAWAWNAHLVSFYAAGDTSTHLCTYRLQTAGRSRVRLDLPEGCHLKALWVDESRVSAVPLDVSHGVMVNLPPGKSLAALTVEFLAPVALPLYWGKQEPEFPVIDVPILARQWTVWLPSGFQVEAADPRWRSHSRTEPTWRGRLFGPLARSRSVRPFNPLRSSNWQQLLATAGRQRPAIERFLATLESAVSPATPIPAKQRSWGELIADAGSKEGSAWLVDQTALGLAGIGPQTPLPVAAAGGDATSAMEELGIVVLLHGKGMVLAGSGTASSYADQLEQLDPAFTYQVLPGPLDDELNRVFQQGGSLSFATVSRWRMRSEGAAPIWKVKDSGSVQGVDSRSWTSYHLTGSSAQVPAVRIVRTSAWWSLGWAAFFIGLAAGLWQAPRGVRWWSASLLGAAAIALIVPAGFSTIFAAWILGQLAALVHHVALHRGEEEPAFDEAESPSRSFRLAGTVPMVSMWLLVAALAGPVFELYAAEPFNRNPVLRSTGPTLPATSPASSGPLRRDGDSGSLGASSFSATRGTNKPSQAKLVLPQAEPQPAPAYKVFVPVDDAERPTGDYLVPEELYNDLYRRQARLLRQPHPWLLSSARYRGTLSRETVEKQLALAELKASFDLHVFRQNVRVRIPLARRGLTIPARSARLEGQPVRIDWEPNGDAFNITAPEPGFYRLELAIQPAVQTAPSSGSFDIEIPAISDSTLELSVPSEGPSIDVPASRGRIVYDRTQGKLSAHLGAINRLGVRWHEGTHAADSMLGTEAEELLWLKIQPGSLVVDARFKLHASEGRVRRLRLSIDPRLRVLPSAAPDPLIAAMHVIGGDPQVLELELNPSMDDPVTVNLSFLLSGTSGVGNIRPPRLESLETRLTKRWVALSIDPALQFTKQAGDAMQPVAVPDFAAAWGPSDANPQIVYAEPRGELTWVLSTQAPDPRTSVEQTQTLGIGGRFAELKYRADFNTEAGYHLQIHFATPADLEIDSVSLLEDGIQRVSRWTRQPDGLTVFLTAPVTGSQRIELRGRMAVASGVTFQPPDIRFRNAQIKSNDLKVFRRPAALVRVHARGEAAPVELPVDEQDRRAFGSFLGSYRLGAPGALALEVSPNVPLVDATEVISLARNDDGWMAEVDCNLNVRQGLVDALRFDVPPNWVEPFVASDQSAVEVVTSAELNRRQVVVRPTSPIKDRYRLKIRGRVIVAQGERLRVPDVALRGAAQVERFVVLPSQVELQELAWDINGLKSAKLPADFKKLPVSPESFVAYQVLGEHFSASLRPAESTTGGAQVLLADITAAWQADGRLFGMATFDVSPGGSVACQLSVPPQYSLQHLSVAGLSGRAREVRPGRWGIELVSSELVQQISIVFSGNLVEGGWRQRRARIALPEIERLPVKHTLLTVLGPPLAGTGEVSGAQRSTPVAHYLARLQSTTEAFELAEHSSREVTPDELVRWRRPWLHRYSALLGKLKRELDDADGASHEKLATLLERSAVAGLEGQATVDAGAPAMPTELGELPTVEAPGSTARPSYCELSGRESVVDVAYAGAARSDFAQRLVASIGLGAFALAGVLLFKDRHLPRLSPRVAAILFGLLWWQCFEPSAPGLAVAVLGVASFALKRRRPRYPVANVQWMQE